MSFDFVTTTHGKWILAGEHSVLRGGHALVFPVPSMTLTLNYQETVTDPLSWLIEDKQTSFQSTGSALITHACSVLGISEEIFTGTISLSSNIPIKSGLGASAALCVALARLCHHKNFISEDQIITFATSLENFFHGKSSGLDIAGCSQENGILFKNGYIASVTPQWNPIWYLSFSGEQGDTKTCVEKVATLWKTNKILAKQLDEHMERAVLDAYQSLQSTEHTELNKLSKAIDQASQCFDAWGLITPAMQTHIDSLKNLGAIATKPTGSGGGGFVISLWKEKLPIHETEAFILV